MCDSMWFCCFSPFSNPYGEKKEKENKKGKGEREAKQRETKKRERENKCVWGINKHVLKKSKDRKRWILDSIIIE